MRKKVFGRKFSRNRKSRKALFRSLMRSLLEHGKIVTTEKKAKAIQKDIDKLVKLAKINSLASVRKINSILGNDREALTNLKLKVGSSFKNRTSGFTKTVILPKRRGDSARMMRLEWSELAETVSKKSVKDSKSKGAKEDKKSDKVISKKTSKVSKKKTLKERLRKTKKEEK